MEFPDFLQHLLHHWSGKIRRWLIRNRTKHSPIRRAHTTEMAVPNNPGKNSLKNIFSQRQAQVEYKRNFFLLLLLTFYNSENLENALETFPIVIKQENIKRTTVRQKCFPERQTLKLKRRSSQIEAPVK